MNVPASQSVATTPVTNSNQASVVNSQQSNVKNEKTFEISAKKNVFKESEDRTFSLENLQDQVENMNKLSEANFTSLKFNVHEQLSRVYVQVINKDTDEVVREIPSEKFLDMMASMLEFVGLLIDKKV